MLSQTQFGILAVMLSFSATAQSSTELTVYSYNSFNSEWGPGPIIKQAFEQNCDCRVKFVTFGDGVMMLNRLKMEGKKTKADVVIGLDNHLMSTAQKTELFAPHQIATTSLLIPWQNQTFIPYDYSYFAFVYNKNKVSQPPESFDDLLNNTHHWRVIYEDPRTSTPGFGLLLWMQSLYGDNVTKKWQQLAKHTVTVTKGWSEAYGLFLKGEADFVLSYSTSPIAHLLNDNETNFATAEFKEGHIQQIEVAGITSTSPHPALARRFLQFILTPEIQRVIATKNVMYPVTETLLPPAFDAVKPIQNILSLTPETTKASQHKIWISTWLNAISQ